MKSCILWLRVLLLLPLPLAFPTAAVAQEYHLFDVKDENDIRSFFRYIPERIPMIGAHRGGVFKGLPENAIATFEHVLKLTHAVIEIDPRLTRDSVVVIMHDETLDRTTTGKGRVADHTWEELQQLRLKDAAGNVTDHRIPTLTEVLRWARGKTILMLDKKDVPMDVLLQHTERERAESYVLVSTYTPQEAAYYHQRNKKIMFEAFILNMETLHAYERLGIPWENVVAYVSRRENAVLYDALHQRNVMCIYYTATGVERMPDKEKRLRAYREAVKRGADIILCDRVDEVLTAIRSLQPASSEKRKYFITQPCPGE